MARMYSSNSEPAVALRVWRTRGNVTGVCLIAPELEVKRLSLLREALPSVHRVAVMSNNRKMVEAGLPPLRKVRALRVVD